MKALDFIALSSAFRFFHTTQDRGITFPRPPAYLFGRDYATHAVHDVRAARTVFPTRGKAAGAAKARRHRGFGNAIRSVSNIRWGSQRRTWAKSPSARRCSKARQRRAARSA